MMELPKEVVIGPFIYSVSVLHGMDAIQLDCAGDFNESTQLIRVNGDRTAENQLETLLHEILHAINYVADIDDNTKEEESVRRLSPFLLMLFRDNPDFLELIINYALKRKNPCQFEKT